MNPKTTWSPGASQSTSGPTSSTTPAPSWPPMIGSPNGRSPVTRCSSEWHSPEPTSRTSTSPCFGRIEVDLLDAPVLADLPQDRRSGLHGRLPRLRRSLRSPTLWHLHCRRSLTSSAMSVTYALEEQVAVITFDDGKANVYTHEVLAASPRRSTGPRRSGRPAVLLVGRPGRFSAGFDLATMTAGRSRCGPWWPQGPASWPACSSNPSRWWPPAPVTPWRPGPWCCWPPIIASARPATSRSGSTRSPSAWRCRCGRSSWPATGCRLRRSTASSWVKPAAPMRRAPPGSSTRWCARRRCSPSAGVNRGRVRGLADAARWPAPRRGPGPPSPTACSTARRGPRPACASRRPPAATGT